ncbi:MAG TPA: helicase C-terminal domain-containing protein [Opitutaceae bacterium]|nr:helicase C-terminal domain-containing protein [Opitutaceae bacterium]
MNFDLDQRRVKMSVGDLSDFSIGPRASAAGSGGLWRAQLGTRWHREIRENAISEGADAEFEVAVQGEIARKGWIIALAGRIDQVIRAGGLTVLREIKTVTRALPSSEAELRADYPGYFVQLAAYAALRGAREGCELVFVEADTGLAQTVPLTSADDRLLDFQLDRVAEFLDLRLRGRERLRQLRFRPAFATLRQGQESAATQLRQAVRGAQSAVLLEAPTGFGKTGVLLECALGELRDGNFERVLYLTGKSTGQIEVVETLREMTAPGPDLGDGAPVAAWHVRNKSEHCVNSVFQCVREACAYLDGAERRWPGSGLSRFYLVEDHPRDLGSLRSAGIGARICPYEITRAALAFNDVWIGDYNYVFSPDSRVLFYDRPGFEPARSLVLIDEAHNLAPRVADAHSHAFAAADARAVCEALRGVRASPEWVAQWDDWARFLQSRSKSGALADAEREDAGDRLSRLAEGAAAFPVDSAALGPHAAGLIWRNPSVADQLASIDLPRLWWCPQDGVLSITCLDAAPAIGAALREFGGVVFATATPGPPDRFAEACDCGALKPIRAATPWRDGAYDVAVDLRVDTSFQHRQRHIATTAETVAGLHRSAGAGAPIAVFFPSYAYAESVASEFGPAALQPRRGDLSAQNAWINESLERGRALFLVLGSVFAEGIDLLGGRVTHAMVVGPALPEVNPVQRARLAALADLGRESAFDRVYRIPGMQKVNQALGRLVRAPGQSARVLLHCQRFAEPSYERLLAPEYQAGRRISRDDDLAAWLGKGA